MTCPSIASDLQATGVTYEVSDIDVVSFNDLTINHGDVQRRVATRNNFYGLNGISVGDLLTDSFEYSLIVGGNLVWSDSGEIFPLDQNVFVGGSSTVPSDLAQRITGNCSSSGCLNSYFDSLSAYWSQFSSSLALQADNVNITFADGIASLSCQSSTDNAYYIRIAPLDFSQIIGYSVSSNCGSSAAWVFNIIGAEDITFAGNPVQVSGYVIFNVGPSAHVIVNSSINGNIVAPVSDINMNGGTIYGQVIAGNFSNIIQINQPNCPASSSSSASGSGLTTGAFPFTESNGDEGSASNLGSGAVSVTASVIISMIAMLI